VLPAVTAAHTPSTFSVWLGTFASLLTASPLVCRARRLPRVCSNPPCFKLLPARLLLLLNTFDPPVQGPARAPGQAAASGGAAGGECEGLGPQQGPQRRGASLLQRPPLL
jgi:hypothetical protein